MTDSIPRYLDTTSNEDEIYKKGMKDRSQFSDFFKSNIDPIVRGNLLKSVKSIDNTENCVTFIGGSRAWDKHISDQTLTEIERLSIVPGNYDVFCITSDESKVDNILQKICVCLDNIIKDFEKPKNKMLNENYTLQYISNTNTDTKNENKRKFYDENLKHYCPINAPMSDEGCVLPACKAIHLELLALDNGKFNEKVIVYFEIIVLSNIEVVREYLLHTNKRGFNYLNTDGLYLFSEMIVRRHKEYDIDSYRRKIIERKMNDDGFDRKTVYHNLIKLYMRVFGKSRDNYKSVLGILIKKYIALYNDDIIDEFSSTITEALRSFINTFIIRLDELVGEKFPDAFMGITGGDAYRRYIPDIKRTNDIDTKVFYKDPYSRSGLQPLILQCLSELTCIVYKNKNGMFTHLFKTVRLGNMIISFKPVYVNENEDDTGQLRTRYINRDTFDLYSIDFRTKILVEFTDVEFPIKILLNHDLAIVDVVLSQTSKRINKKDVITYSNGVPVVSSLYLKDDLIQIYHEISDNLKMRLPKREKDKKRFAQLVEFLNKSKYLFSNQPTQSKLKRKAGELFKDLQVGIDSKRRFFKKQINELEDTFDVDITIHNFLRFPLINNGTLDVHFPQRFYIESIKNYTSDIYTYTNLLQDKIRDNNDVDKEKFLLTFNDVVGVFANNDFISEFSRLKI